MLSPRELGAASSHSNPPVPDRSVHTVQSRQVTAERMGTPLTRSVKDTPGLPRVVL